MFSAVALKSLDVKALVEELRVRMLDELDYRLEASCQADFADRYRGHPYVHVPDVVPELVEAYTKYRDQGVVVLGVSLDDTAEMLREYAPTKEMNYPLLLMQDDFDEAYGPIFGVPITFVIGRDGTISRRHFGPVSKEQLDREIKALL